MEAGNYGFGTWRPETSKEEDGATSGGAATFHTPVQETPAADPSARVRPREKNGGDGKAGNRNDQEEVRSGRRRDSSTPVPETSEVAPKRQRKTEEMRGGRAETWLKTSIHGRKEEADEEAKDEAAVEFDGEAQELRIGRTGR